MKPVEAIKEPGLSAEVIKRFTAEHASFPAAYLKDIRGGIRDAHLHLENEIVLLNQENFGGVKLRRPASIGFAGR